MTLRVDPRTNKLTDLSRSIYHETCHRLEDIDGYMERDDDRGETDQYIHRNTNYMEQVIERIGNEFKLVEIGAQKGHSPEQLLALYKNAKEEIYNLKKLQQMPNSIELQRIFGFSFDPSGIEDFYLNNSKYPNLRKAIKLYRDQISPPSVKPKPAVKPKPLPPGTGYWKLIETIVRTPEPTDRQRFTCSNGSGEAHIVSSIGCKWSSSAKWSAPPSVILPNDTVKISMALLISEYYNGENGDQGLNYMGAGMSAVCDNHDVDFGFITASAIRFKNAEGKEGISVNGEWGKKLVQSDSIDVFAKLGPGSKGMKKGVKVNYYDGQSAGAKYVYEWTVVPGKTK